MPAHTRLYEVLGIDPSSSNEDVKRAYKKMAIKCHPDKNPGNEEQFKDISTAYAVLSDPKKKALYDEFGEEALKDDFSPNNNDIFSQLFGGGRRSSNQRQKGENVVIPHEVTLEELYNGKVTKISLKKNVLCADCEGKGGKNVRRCDSCNGAGVKMMMRQRGFLVEQLQVECAECNGNGEKMKPNDRCKKCKGNKVIPEKKTLDLYIDKGMTNKQKIVFSGEGDQHPEIDAGDIIFVIQQKEHPVFTRDGTDLIMTKEISLVDALCGFSFILTHLDGRHLNIKTAPGQVIAPDQSLCIENEGMPTYRSIYDIGKLVIKFNVKFPDAIDANTAKKLRELLPNPPQDVSMEVEHTETEDHILTPYVKEEKSKRQQQQQHRHIFHNQGDDEDEDEDENGHGHEGGQRVQCAQQ